MIAIVDYKAGNLTSVKLAFDALGVESRVSSDINDIRKNSHGSIISMTEDAMEKLQGGETTLEELLRTLPYSKIYQFRNLT